MRDEANAGGDFRCVYVNVEVGQSAREDVGAAMRAILSALASEARYALDDRFLDDAWPGVLRDAGPHDALRETLARWSGSDAKPLVLLIDEIDALIGDTLLAVLRQLRAGCGFRGKPITDSGRNRSLIPIQTDHRFRSKPITLSRG